MKRRTKLCLGISALAVAATCVVRAQTTSPAPSPAGNGSNATVAATPAAIRVSQEDPAAVQRGAEAFAASCASCHGATAKGTDVAPDLIRSTLVEDDVKASLIGPVLRAPHPKGASQIQLTDQQISDLAAWLRVQVYGAAFRQTYAYQDIVVGNAKRGEQLFSQKCGSCHSATGDLAGIASKYTPPALQGQWITGGGPLRNGGGRGARGGPIYTENGSMIADTAPPDINKGTLTITVTLPTGESFTGVPISITDFNIAFKDVNGVYHSYDRKDGFPKIVVHNPLQAHADFLKTLNDTDMHDITAYLVSLK